MIGIKIFQAHYLKFHEISSTSRSRTHSNCKLHELNHVYLRMLYKQGKSACQQAIDNKNRQQLKNCTEPLLSQLVAIGDITLLTLCDR